MRITCDVIQDLMPSYVDGILSEDSQALVKEHMEACKECRNYERGARKRAGSNDIICSLRSTTQSW